MPSTTEIVEPVSFDPREVRESFGEAWGPFASQTPRFFPRLQRQLPDKP